MQLKSRAGAINPDLLRKQDWTTSCYAIYPPTTEVYQGTEDINPKYCFNF